MRRNFKRRRLTRRGTYSRVRRYRRTSKSARGIASKALRIARTANQKELKHLTAYVRNSTPGRQINDLTFDQLGGIAQGLSDDAGRIGDSVWLKSITLRGTIQIYTNRERPINSTAGNMYNYMHSIRMWIALWPIPQATAAADASSLFEANDMDFIAPYGNKFWDARFRSRLLYNKVYIVHGYKPIVQFNVKVPINMPVQWDQISGLISKNKVLYGWQSDVTTSVTYARVDHTFQFTYTDS